MSHEASATNPRVLVTEGTKQLTINLLMESLARRILEKGHLSFAGKHEALGVIDEEHYELLVAVHSKIPRLMVPEALDLAVGCLWMVATLLEKHPELKVEFLERLNR